MTRPRSPATAIAYLRRDLRNACTLLDMAAGNLSAFARSTEPAVASQMREFSSNYARAAHELMPKRGKR